MPVVKYEYDGEGENRYVTAIVIDGETFYSLDGAPFIIPKYLLTILTLAEIEPGLKIEVCHKVSDDYVIVVYGPFCVTVMDNDKALVEFEDWGIRKYWDRSIGLKLYMETKRDILSERERELSDLEFKNYEDDGNYIRLEYSAILEGETFKDIINQAEQIINEIEGATELTLGSPFSKDVNDTENESEFSISVLIPLLRRLGFANVKYDHGNREFGKDITFSRKTEFEEYEYWGVQAKFGDISGEANSEIDKIIAQIDDAFKLPFYDVYTRSKQKISKLVIAISGKFTNNAEEKICEKIESSPLKNNIVFIDAEKIRTLAEKFRIKI